MPSARLDFSAVKQRSRFETVLARYGFKVVGRGAQRFVLCPFHKEATASCSVHLEKRLFHCFGCGAKGTIIDFVAMVERIPLDEAAAKIVEWCGHIEPSHRLAVRENSPPIPPAADANRGQRTTAPLKYRLVLDPTHPYLSQRGLDPNAIELFGLGYCDRGIMRGRIAIPIHNQDGQLIAYAGRWAEEQVPSGRPRYLLPPGFQKQLVLFNLHRVKSENSVVIVESCWSVFRLAVLGIAAVALMGRELSAAQTELLITARTLYVRLMLDGDAPGRAATAKILPILAQHFFVRDLQLPERMKPHSAAEHELQRLLASGPS